MVMKKVSTTVKDASCIWRQQKSFFFCLLLHLLLFMQNTRNTYRFVLAGYRNDVDEKLSSDDNIKHVISNDDEFGVSSVVCELHNNITSIPRVIEKFRHRLWPLTNKNYPNPKLAYKMAILSSMSYWEFHRWDLTTRGGNASNESDENSVDNKEEGEIKITGFRLLQDSLPRTSHRSRIRYGACRIKVKAKSIRDYVYDSYRVKSSLQSYIYDTVIKQGRNLLWGSSSSNDNDNDNVTDNNNNNDSAAPHDDDLNKEEETSSSSSSSSSSPPSSDYDYENNDNNNNFINYHNNYTTTTKTTYYEYVSSRKVCKDRKKLKPDSYKYTFQYWLYNWNEPTFVAGIKFHDTDILIATTTKEDDNNNFLPQQQEEIIISFGGSASPADLGTNIQTFEFANHSNFFNGGGSVGAKEKNNNNDNNSNSKQQIQGSIHRGFLNAYSRVIRGSVLRINPPPPPIDNDNLNSTTNTKTTEEDLLLPTLNDKFGHCWGGSSKSNKQQQKQQQQQQQQQQKCRSTTSNNKFSVDCNSYDEMDATTSPNNNNNNIPTPSSPDNNNNIKEIRGSRSRRNGGCKVRDEKLFEILRQICLDAINKGHKVRLTGHSLGGGLATLLALDLIINFPDLPIHNLDLWTFGAPQIADDKFFESAKKYTGGRRLQEFENSQTHRYVTISDKCQVDAISEVAKNTLPSHKDTLQGKLIGRKLGGVHGQLIHFGEPHFLLTPEQYNNNNNAIIAGSTQTATGGDATTATSTTTRSSFSAHSLTNYLKGISRESRHHPLSTDLPTKIAEFLGEYI